jgi:hypothetical protein
MRKVIVAFEAPNFSEGAMRFVSQMNKSQAVTLTGIFLPRSAYTVLPTADAMAPGMFLPLTDETGTSELNAAVKTFKQYCTDNYLRYRLIKNVTDFALTELKQQSRYADLIVLGGESFFNLLDTDKLSDYQKTSLHDAECPVIVVPENFSRPKYNILTYDGSESSVRAIKNFAYLFPEMAKNPTTVVTFGSKGASQNKAGETRAKELVSVHFPDYKFTHSGSDSKKYFSDWSPHVKPAIVVCGAFGRSILSVLFKHSFIADVLKEQKLPVFISHT